MRKNIRAQNFKTRVLAIVAQIPKEQVLSYGEVAMRAGNSKAYRAVGNILNKNHNSAIPCHRVIGAHGALGGYNGGAKNKMKRLKEEGVCMERRGKDMIIIR